MINYITSSFKWFFKLEAASGLLLLISAIVALIISNSNFSSVYFDTLASYIFIGLNDFGIKMSLLHWINDALMAIFFFFVTLEIKREFLEGELSSPKQASLPIIAAIGGMLVPALFYVYFNYQNSETLKGWAIPSATDIAFSLGVLSLLLIVFIFLIFLNKFNVKKFIPYLLLGLILWLFTHESGIHATIAGVLLATVIPHRKKEKDFSLLTKIEHKISPYVAFGIMPLFALANAGVSLEGVTFDSLLFPVPLGILLGLFIGKQLGVILFSFIAIKFKISKMPTNANLLSFYGVSILTGIGFTMSLFVGNLAFADNIQYIDGVKIGVLSGSLLSTLFGYFILLISKKN